MRRWQRMRDESLNLSTLPTKPHIPYHSQSVSSIRICMNTYILIQYLQCALAPCSLLPINEPER
jgi:hypothetical protein